MLGKRAVKLFFCKTGKKEAWKVLLTTDLSLRFMCAYEIYAMRWSIEVFFSDSKRLLGLADCSSRDFSPYSTCFTGHDTLQHVGLHKKDT